MEETLEPNLKRHPKRGRPTAATGPPYGWKCEGRWLLCGTEAFPEPGGTEVRGGAGRWANGTKVHEDPSSSLRSQADLNPAEAENRRVPVREREEASKSEKICQKSANLWV